jgi:hypothetical protein
VPASPAELAIGTVTRDASLIIRQLEHRIRDLPALQQHLAARQQDTLSEAAAARHALTQPFKYAAQLDQAAATRADRHHITQRIKARHEHDATRDASPAVAGGDDEAARERQHLDAAGAQRLAAAAFPSPTPVSTIPDARTGDTSRGPGQTPPRVAQRPSRSR